ncbi:HlyC/CorC family transporter [Thiospirochaeta perfilievii]|uniref:HlyC/CorC family transporter n=1 Tax=Thiospirochaeta perfilievii TaxID=252967 RepID=A0A5C1QB04_9SPIO|nr:hemolysin family protein [Thiospirochaeta perfilievii]QEN04538.1 HlyC/CorC family transporter [Thiospirochaeta perfilievii]
MDIIALVVLLILSGFFSGTETAFTSLSLSSIHSIIKRNKKRGHKIERLVNHPQILLTTILIGNNIVNIGATTLTTTIVINRFGNFYIGFASGILVLFILIFGEVTPKQIAMGKNEFICYHTVNYILVISIIFRPLIFFITIISNFISGFFVKSSHKEITEEGLLNLVEAGSKMGVVEDYESQMVKDVFRINDTPIHGIMTHRKDVVRFDGNLTTDEIFPVLLEEGLSRIPVYEDSDENIIGIILFKDIVKLTGEERCRPIKDFSHKPIFVPGSNKVNELFIKFKIEKLNIAIVLDEYGGLDGIVTREDILEEIFGEMYDENETFEEAPIIKLNNKTWKVAGDSSFYDIEDIIGLSIPHDLGTQTINGYLTELLGNFPSPGTSIETEEGHWSIEKVESNCISSLIFVKKD